MERVVVVQGHVSDPSRIELDEPLRDIYGTVEVIIRATHRPLLGSPLAILEAMRALPDLDDGDVDELERMIEAGRLPTRADGLFDEENA